MDHKAPRDGRTGARRRKRLNVSGRPAARTHWAPFSHPSGSAVSRLLALSSVLCMYIQYMLRVVNSSSGSYVSTEDGFLCRLVLSDDCLARSKRKKMALPRSRNLGV
jgi:hypothetical protein